MAARVTQEYVEVVILPTSNARVTQDYVEVVVGPVSNARVTQDYVEVVIENGRANLKRNHGYIIGED